MQLCLPVRTQDFDPENFITGLSYIQAIFGPLRCTTLGELQTKCTESARRVRGESGNILGGPCKCGLPAKHWNEELGPTESLYGLYILVSRQTRVYRSKKKGHQTLHALSMHSPYIWSAIPPALSTAMARI